jgi:hypothetical protein
VASARAEASVASAAAAAVRNAAYAAAAAASVAITITNQADLQRRVVLTAAYTRLFYRVMCVVSRDLQMVVFFWIFGYFFFEFLDFSL